MRRMLLRDLIGGCDSLDWRSELYLPRLSERWAETTPCVVLEEDEEETNQEAADYIAKNGLTYVLSVQAVQDVMANARSQEPKVALSKLLEALVYYFENDAFLVLKSVKDSDENAKQ